MGYDLLEGVAGYAVNSRETGVESSEFLDVIFLY